MDNMGNLSSTFVNTVFGNSESKYIEELSSDDDSEVEFIGKFYNF